MHLRPDTITYGTAELGIIRAECVAFAISPRNSAAAVANLINRMGSRHVIVTPDLKPLIDAAISILEGEMSEIPAVQFMPTFSDLFPDDDSKDFEYLPEPQNESVDDPICILHSSGTPKHFRSIAVSIHEDGCCS